MAREHFIDNLRRASRLLLPPAVSNNQGSDANTRLSGSLSNADLWLTTKVVADYDPKDFANWPQETQERLAQYVAAFLSIANIVPADKPATHLQSVKAQKSLNAVIQLVGRQLLDEWLKAQHSMLDDAANAAKTKGWFVQQDEKEVIETMLGTYKAPRLRIRTMDKEVVLDPIGLFCSGKQGVVDLVLLPAFETKYLVTFKEGQWRIVTPNATSYTRPFSATTFVNTVSQLKSGY